MICVLPRTGGLPAAQRGAARRLLRSAALPSGPSGGPTPQTSASFLLEEFIGSEEAVSIVARCYTPAEACEKLAAEARQRWLVEECGVVDDITVLIVAFAEVEEDSGEEGGEE